MRRLLRVLDAILLRILTRFAPVPVGASSVGAAPRAPHGAAPPPPAQDGCVGDPREPAPAVDGSSQGDSDARHDRVLDAWQQAGIRNAANVGNEWGVAVYTVGEVPRFVVVHECEPDDMSDVLGVLRGSVSN